MTKGLIISTLVILLLFALAIFLSSYCVKTINEIKELVFSLPDDISSADPSQLFKIQSIWTSRRQLISLVIRHDLLVNTDIGINTLCAYAKGDTDSDFIYAKSTLLSCLDSIRQMQNISFDAVF